MKPLSSSALTANPRAPGGQANEKAPSQLRNKNLHPIIYRLEEEAMAAGMHHPVYERAKRLETVAMRINGGQLALAL